MLYQRHLISFIFYLLLLPTLIVCLLDGLYCGKQNCYDVLGVTRDSSKNEIGKAYRTLARKYHPDLHRTTDTKAEAEVQFKHIATAYEILKDDDSRNNYDYMLDHPDEYYAHYYRYYRRRVAPKVDVRIVIVVILTVISIIQYYSGWQRYDSAIKYFATVPKYRNKALKIAKDEINEKINNRKGKQRLNKIEQKEELERIVRKVIEEKMDVKGAKPSLWDILLVQLIIFPYTLMRWLLWQLNWLWRFTICRRPYGQEEKLYLIRRLMKMSQSQFNTLEDSQIEEYLQLWKQNEEEWKQNKKQK